MGEYYYYIIHIFIFSIVLCFSTIAGIPYSVSFRPATGWSDVCRIYTVMGFHVKRTIAAPWKWKSQLLLHLRHLQPVGWINITPRRAVECCFWERQHSLLLASGRHLSAPGRDVLQGRCGVTATPPELLGHRSEAGGGVAAPTRARSGSSHTGVKGATFFCPTHSRWLDGWRCAGGGIFEDVIKLFVGTSHGDTGSFLGNLNIKNSMTFILSLPRVTPLPWSMVGMKSLTVSLAMTSVHKCAAHTMLMSELL